MDEIKNKLREDLKTLQSQHGLHLDDPGNPETWGERQIHDETFAFVEQAMDQVIEVLESKMPERDDYQGVSEITEAFADGWNHCRDEILVRIAALKVNERQDFMNDDGTPFF